MITFQVESYDQIIGEIVPLNAKHYAEIEHDDRRPLAIDYQLYAKAEGMGLAKTFTIRADSRLIGYAVFFVSHLFQHKNDMSATCRALWLDPSFRGRLVGKRLLKYIEAELSKGGPVEIHIGSNVRHPELSRLLVAKGYAQTEIVHVKRVEQCQTAGSANY